MQDFIVHIYSSSMKLALFFGAFTVNAEHDMWIIVGAFSGSIVFIVSAIDFSPVSRCALFTASLCIGIAAAGFTASTGTYIIQRVVGVTIHMPVAVGAVISSALAVRLLVFLCAKPKSNISIFDFLKPNKRK